MNIKTRGLAAAALFSALICVGAWIKIPFIFVPMTLQFFFVNTAILSQRSGYASLSVGAYVFMGLAGLPLFSGGGGPAYIFSPTFGYLIGFLAAAIISGFVGIKVNKLFRSLINIAVVYLFGLPYLYLILNFYLGTGITITKTIIYGCLIFLPGDIMGIILSCTLTKRLERLAFYRGLR